MDKEKYKVLIIDNNKQIHTFTKSILKNFSLEGRSIKFIDAYSSQNAMKLLVKYEDIAIVLLNSEMEEKSCSVKLIKYIRNIKKDNFTRIILATEKKENISDLNIIVDYDISDYLCVLNDTKERIFICIYSALRAYNHIVNNYLISQKVIKTQVEMIHTLGDVIESRSQETANHVKRVSEISYFIGKKLNLSNEDCIVLKMSSMVHDVGKIGINDNVLLKPGKLTEEEFNMIKKHTEIGHDIFCDSELEVLKKAAEICLHHHEKYNGTGYPSGLKGNEISLFSRIVSVTDVFDAISHKRCYKDAWSIEEAKDYIAREKGVSFDPEIVDVFMNNISDVLKLCNKYPD